jgi:hypothetical protein
MKIKKPVTITTAGTEKVLPVTHSYLKVENV